MIKLIAFYLAVAGSPMGAAVATPRAEQALSATSPTCGQVAGKTQKDVDAAIAFCRGGVPSGLVSGIIAMESLVWLKVTREVANIMLADTLQTEQVIKGWMRGWRQVSGSRSVTVAVEWGDVEIATGQTTLLSGDRVTFRQR